MRAITFFSFLFGMFVGAWLTAIAYLGTAIFQFAKDDRSGGDPFIDVWGDDPRRETVRKWQLP